MDGGRVLREQADAGGGDDRIGGVVAVDEGRHAGRDAVVGRSTRTAEGQAEVQATGHRHRAREDEGVDRLVARGADQQCAARMDGGVCDVCRHLQRCVVQADDLPGVGVGEVLRDRRDLAPQFLVAVLSGVAQRRGRQVEFRDVFVDGGGAAAAHLDAVAGLDLRRAARAGVVVGHRGGRAQVFVDIALAHAARHAHGVAVVQGLHVVGGKMDVCLLLVARRTDQVARQRNAD